MESSLAIAAAPSLWFRVRRALSSFPGRAREAFVRWALDLLLRFDDSNLVAHARRELPPDDGDDMQKAINRDVLQIVALFAMHGHSGFSAPYTIAMLEKLLRFEPLGPLTGADDEWIDHGYCMQNKRCGHVFKRPDRFNGQAYDIEGRIFREPNGSCYTSRDSMVPITFPYTPKSEYVDVPSPVAH